MKNINLEKWIIFHAFLMVFSGIYALLTASLKEVLVVSFFSFGALGYLNKAAFKQFKPYGGYANWVTFTRFFLLLFLVGYQAKIADSCLFIGLLISIAMDGLDGWCARRYRQESYWGGLFDKEVDSMWVWSISMVLYLYKDFALWIVGIGLLHYIYEIVLYLLNWQYLKTPRNPIGRYVALLLFFSLLSPFILPNKLAIPILGIASFLTLISFSISFIYKYREVAKQ